MTTNIDRAIGIIEDEHDPHFGPIDAPSLVYALSNAGLLMPDQPEPNSVLDDHPEWLLETEFKNLSISALEDDGLRVTLDLLDDAMETVLHSAHYSVADAKSIAYALLAAADYAEQEQGNV